MTTAFAALLIGVAGAALVLALVAYFWVNRTPSPNERFDEYGRVPLFGVDLVAGNESNAEPKADVGRAAEVFAEPETVRKAASDFRPPSAERDDARTPLSGEPVAIDTSALNQPSANGTSANDHASAPAQTGKAEIRPNQRQRDRRTDDNGTGDNGTGDNRAVEHRTRDNRLGGKGWGASPGWPAPELATPRYVPPVSSDVRPIQQSTPASPTPASSSNGNGVNPESIPGSMVEGHNLRFSTPAEGTLQFLPGRLEISSGLDTGREIRFVRVPGPNGTEVTFGRNEGALYRHIQLRDQTVSREHARMTLIDGRWLLTNLSKTNPVAHNGRILGLGEHQLLEDGDRLDMGEVIFSFRSR